MTQTRFPAGRSILPRLTEGLRVATARSFQQTLVGVFGFPVVENPTQAMVEAAFADMGLDWRYLTVAVRPQNLADAVRGAVAMGWRGFNCTIPHKVAVAALVDHMMPETEAIGAVNCVVIEDGALVGVNTDGKGFLQSLTSVRPAQGLRAVILGAGGAARAIAVELARAGAKDVTIVNRSLDRAQGLAEAVQRVRGRVKIEPWVGDYRVPPGTDLVVNATSIGLYPDLEARVPVDVATFNKDMIVADVIPNPPRTRLVRDAVEAGCTVLDGLGMLVNQGVIGIQLWTGRDPRPIVMRQALESIFGG
jgi:shikimate dehydrogenase